MSPALKESLLGFDLLLLSLHTPLSLFKSFQVLLVFKQLDLKLFPLTVQPLSLQEALLLPLPQLTLLLTLKHACSTQDELFFIQVKH